MSSMILRQMTPAASAAGRPGVGAAGGSRSTVRPARVKILARAIPGDEMSEEERRLRMVAGPRTQGGTRVSVANRGAYQPVNSSSYMDDVANLSVDLDDIGVQESRRPAFVDDSANQAARQVDWAARQAARQLVEDHVPAQIVANKHDWMLVLVPETPIAGEDLVMYFNRSRSDALRDRPRISLQYGFNNWELQANGGMSTTDLMPSRIGREMGSDFYACRIKVPSDSYELNFVLSDGEGTAFENNADQDFMFPVRGGTTRDQWIDKAAEAAAFAAAAKLTEQQESAAQAENLRQMAALEEDKTRATQQTQDMRSGGYNQLREGGAQQWDADGDRSRPLWKTTVARPAAGSRVTLLYNRLAGPMNSFDIPSDQCLELKFGFNGWTKPGEASMTRATAMTRTAPADQEWWSATVDVPFEACSMNFAVAYYEHFDNGGGSDHKLLLELPAGSVSVSSWVDKLTPMFFEQIHSERLSREAFWKRKNDARSEERAMAQAMVKEVERRKVRHVLYTEPEVVTAGKDVTLFYNPSNTVLNGRQRVWLKGGWNRWNHAKGFGPVEMTRAGGGTHFKATVKAPADAFKMDFVFSDVAEGDGTYDTRGGFDYHLPVEGSAVREAGLYVVHISVEMAPIAKVGGLGDVLVALGRAVQEQGHLAEVILPKYAFFDASPILGGQLKYECEFDWGGTKVYVTTAIVEGLRCWFIEPKNGYFDTGSVYGRKDDEMRFDFFCKAALEFLLRTGRQPDILHCHDWSTAHVAKSFWHEYQPNGLYKPKVVFTIHNMSYGKAKLAEAAYFSQKFTTVSPTYALEVGDDAAISSNSHKFMGIRNGIDLDLWDPANNQWLPMQYSADTVVQGKAAARKALRDRLGLTGWGDKVIVGVVSRLTSQKGVPLIKHTAFRTVERGGQFVLLGSAPDPKVQSDFNGLAGGMGGENAAFCFMYDEPLSHLIYAACDIIVVPSMFEPCGLTQMIAMRYGAIPVVRHTGGLRDTVFDVDFDKERAAWDVYGSSDWQRDNLDATNGFAFDGVDASSLDYALNRAIDAWYNDRTWFHALQKRVMEQDWSWNRPALDYIELYHSAKKA